MKSDLYRIPDGISEFTFGGLYFFKDSYKYQVSKVDESAFILRGEEQGKPFFCVIGSDVSDTIIQELYRSCGYWKLISDSLFKTKTQLFEQLGAVPEEDRNNFDYLYTRSALSTLSGKQLHKKKNHVNGFLNNYPDFSLQQMNKDTQADAYHVLESWAAEQQDLLKTDYQAACRALELLETGVLFGLILYVQTTPAAWCLAELTAQGSAAVVHFEKARTDFRGSYQYINYAFAQSLPETIMYINREQDLGDEGLRRAKMSYRPERFIKKYRLKKGAV
ncbi:MAG: phosphatidylglycerol lysyltransferase domain-containing protein [Treponema sp.]